MRTIILLLTIATGWAMTIPSATTDFKELCSEEEAELEYERTKFYELTQCLAKVLNATEFRQEITRAGDASKVDAVITKVCKNLPEIVQCTSVYVSSIGPCMDDNEKREKELWKNLRQMNMEFACGPGRHHLIKFIDEGGFQCIATHRNGISQCVNSKFPTLLKQKSDTQIVKTLALITKENGKCNSLKEVEGCVNSELVKCMEPGSLSIIRQYFSSLDVLFACDNSSTEQPQYSQPRGVVLERESLQVLSRILESVEQLVVASEQRAEVQEASDRRVMEVLERQAAAVDKIVNLLDNVIIPKLHKEKRSHPE